MKKMMIRALAFLLVCVLSLSLSATAYASGTFNAGVTITDRGDLIEVTIPESNAAVLEAHEPKLSVVCAYERAYVMHNELPVVSALKDGKITFTVSTPGTYTIYKQYVATNGDESYSSLEEALAAASDNVVSKSVELIVDIEIASGRSVCIPDGVTLVISKDITLTNNGTIKKLGTIEKLGTITGNGTILCAEHQDEQKTGLCDVCGYSSGVVLAGYTASLESNIEMNFHVALSDEVKNDKDAKMVFTQPNGNQVSINVADAAASGAYNIFTCEVAAKEMTAPITAQVITSNGQSQLYSYSVKEYADALLADPSKAGVHNVVKSMLAYGTYAQLHFGYNQTNLAYDIVDVSDVTAQTLSSYAKYGRQGTQKVWLAGSSLLLKSDTVLRLFFTVDDSVKDSVTFTYKGQVLPVREVSGYYTVNITDIAAQYLDDDVTITVSDGTEEKNVTYSVLAYCHTVLANSGSYEETHLNVVKALYRYGEAADQHFNP